MPHPFTCHTCSIPTPKDKFRPMACGEFTTFADHHTLDAQDAVGSTAGSGPYILSQSHLSRARSHRRSIRWASGKWPLQVPLLYEARTTQWLPAETHSHRFAGQSEGNGERILWEGGEVPERVYSQDRRHHSRHFRQEPLPLSLV